MHLKEAIDVLKKHNDWRRGHEGTEPTDPKTLGNAIDYAVIFMSEHLIKRDHHEPNDCEYCGKIKFSGSCF